MSTVYDLIVIGSGPAGQRAAIYGAKLGKKLWFEQEELTDEEMAAAEQQYVMARPKIMLTHDAPADIARQCWQNARRYGAPDPKDTFQPSRTNMFLSRLADQHAPRLWLFGHHHRDWRCRNVETLYMCTGELSFVDIDAEGNVVKPK